MKSNNGTLKGMLKKYDLTRKEVAALMGIHTSTVDRWLAPRTKKGEKNPTFRAMPDSKMILFGMVLANLKKKE